MDESLYVMSSTEIVWGYLPGHVGTLPRPLTDAASPRQALESVVREALMRPPCGVAFSGGRDSSVLLAVATHVARREGLPEPVPITKRFPRVADADESQWQEIVVRHLGLSHWERIVIHDEIDLVGPLAATHLAQYGVLWPPTIHGDIPVLEVLRDGSLIDGEGGDEVFGVAAHRIAPVGRLIREPRPLRWYRIRSALGAVAPARVRANHLRRRLGEQPLPWLRPAARQAMDEALIAVDVAQPLSFAASVRMVPRRRTQTLALHNRRILATQRHVELSTPLLHPDVVHALARNGGVLGLGDRTATLRALVPDLLPDTVLSRTDKAEFSGAYVSNHTREFAEGWTGDGVDPDLVDPCELRRLWLHERGVAPTSALLQAAWLANHRPARQESSGTQ